MTSTRCGRAPRCRRPAPCGSSGLRRHLPTKQKVHFWALTTMRRESDYLVFHQVNTCLLAIVFGAELGLTKAQLRDRLGFIALFHDAGMATPPRRAGGKRAAA